ncbi:MAG TPA: hypothetical protein VFS21_21405 [Roseiflexaceae bacterium]|nr:hypothetical protein [Roseiflexaceae bacterium]
MTATTTAQRRPLEERAADIARMLGPGWTVAERDQDRIWRYTRLDGPDGSGIYMESSNGRIYVTGTYPHDLKHGSYAPRELPKISIAEGRPVGEIAREITRRFLPAYNAAYAKARADQRSNEETWATEHRLMQRLGPLVGATAPSHEPTRAYGHANGVYAEINTRGARINLRLDGVPEEIAARVLAIVGNTQS